GEQPWRQFELPAPSEARAWTKTEFETATGKLQSEIEKGSQAGDHISVLLEDVTNETWYRAVGLLEKFKNRTRFCVITTHDLKLLDQDPRALTGSVRVEVFTIAAVFPTDAEAYITHRVQQFREPQRPELSAMFPFTPDYIKHCITDDSPVTLRVLN